MEEYVWVQIYSELYIYSTERWNNTQQPMGRGRERENQTSRSTFSWFTLSLYLTLSLYDRNVGVLIAILIWWWKEASCKTVLWNHIFSTEHLYKRTSYVKNIPLLLRKYFREISVCCLSTFLAISEKHKCDLGSSPLPLDSSESLIKLFSLRIENTEDTDLETLKIWMNKEAFYFIS